jgi:hypothetical protein
LRATQRVGLMREADQRQRHNVDAHNGRAAPSVSDGAARRVQVRLSWRVSRA